MSMEKMILFIKNDTKMFDKSTNIHYNQRSIIKSLGYPIHVCLRINDSNRSFAIIPCEAYDVMSFKIP